MASLPGRGTSVPEYSGPDGSVGTVPENKSQRRYGRRDGNHDRQRKEK